MSASFDLTLPDEVVAMRQAARGLALGRLDAVAREVDTTGQVPADVAGHLRDMGFTCVVDSEFGGGGVPDTHTQLIGVETLAHGDPSIVGAEVFTGGGALLLSLLGTAGQRRCFLPGAAAGSAAAPAVALYERFEPSPRAYDTEITRMTDGRYLVRGEKVAVALGGGADHVIVVGRDPEQNVLRAAVVALADIEVASAPAQGHLAMSSAGLTRIRFDVTVDADALLRDEADGVTLAQAVARTRLLPAAVALGGATRAREYATRYATERVAFGRPIISFQGVSFTLADNHMQLDAARLGLWSIATALDGFDDDRLADEVGRIVAECHAAATTATRDAIQILGGHGFLTDHPVELWYRCTALLSTIDCDPRFTRFAPAV
ncbi:acyl-CoA dehydrogenase family protein [Streptosporangium sp. NPDC049046]|uniref:acyl-CoA dehydrogenase family protein n=1 Tax=Streptosporangium sp. NPDC049046 TaxID=3155031 RepID=UPI00341601B1